MALTPRRRSWQRDAGEPDSGGIAVEGKGTWWGTPHLFISWRGHITLCTLAAGACGAAARSEQRPRLRAAATR